MNTLSPAGTRNDAPVPYIALDPKYVTGLCDGGASFNYSRTSTTIRLRFVIKLNAADKTLIFALQDFFGVGAIYRCGPAGQENYAGKTGPSWQFCVTKKTELQRIVDHFERHPLVGAKAEAYRVWKKIYELTSRGALANWAEAQDLAVLLSSLSTKGRRANKPEHMR